MEVKWYTPDKNGKVTVDGITFKVRESVKYRNYLNATYEMGKVKNVLVFGISLVVLGMFFLIGSLGRIELYSLRNLVDDWSTGQYIFVVCIGTIMFIVGSFVVRWGWSKETIYKRWIDEYLGQFTTDREAVEE